MSLSDTKLKSLLGKTHAGTCAKKLSDRDGLTIYWSPKGKLSFYFRFRFHGKGQQLKLGTYPLLSLKVARKKAEVCKKWLEEGHNPVTQIKLVSEQKLTPVTVECALEYWIDKYAKTKRKNWAKTQQQFKAYIYPKIGNLPVEQCETRHWIVVFEEYAEKSPVGAGYAFQASKQALKYCKNRKYAYSNALDELNISDVAKSQTPKDRVLSLVELRDILAWAKDYKLSSYYQWLAVLLIYTGARTQEVRLSESKEWDLEAKVWTVPRSHSKNNKVITRPIPCEIIPLIKFLLADNPRYLLGELKRPEAVSTYASSLNKRLGHSKWNWHDIRRSFSTFLNEAEEDTFIIEMLLGHSIGGVAAHYDKAPRLEQKRRVYRRWERLLSGASDNVFVLRSANGAE
ncbi:tyrosine-type recombinase/integrase [Paraferrimonas haliotis]|uniref:Integrase n=1 Tax=Paraferrimonas haliotis TaxID=2013866 RepID=A0AA37WWE3_9GAMM|nr:site-specific integrase [Paraferrimonas haliotis]GLS83448.1 integrase [Paraferrimonas haliotis]